MKAVAKLKSEQEAEEPVMSVTGNVTSMKINSDTHMKIVISKKVGDMIKKRISLEDHSIYTSWDEVFLKWLQDKRKNNVVVDDDEDEEDKEEHDTHNKEDQDQHEDEDNADVFALALFGVPMAQLQHQPLHQNTVDRLKKLYKHACKIEKEYFVTPDSFMVELIETYEKAKELKIITSESAAKPKTKPKSWHYRHGSKHKKAKIQSLDQLASSSPR